MQAMKFDYIIVGAGSAGCVLADKLSESGEHNVLLIEAGGSDAKFWIKVPLGYGITVNDPKLNWGYHTQPDPELNNREIYWPRGRVIGGSSSINAMAYMRGLPHDFDDWERGGATGWNWTRVRETYSQLEAPTGPVTVSDLRRDMHPFSAHFINAASDMGWATHDDINCGLEGLSYYRSTVRKGLRWSAVDAFLRPALKRKNLHVIHHALVERIVIENGRARGVRYRRGDQVSIAHAQREVIVSGGAINSPQILQLSGIGPSELLRQHGIDVAHHLPQVGQNMQDHLAVSHQFYATEPTLNAQLGTALGRMMAGIRYLTTLRGPLSVPVNQVGGYVRSHAQAATPDLQMFCNPASFQIGPDGKPILDTNSGFLICAQPCRPTSRGQIAIASANARDAPLITPNSLATQADRDAAVRACKVIDNLARTPALRAVTKAVLAPDLGNMNDDQMLDNFCERASTVYHPTCTCRMGRDAQTSVVDSTLKVHGMTGLRVVDASVFPNITSGNTNAPTLMLALRAAQMILTDARG